jgi:hypothetical protein
MKLRYEPSYQEEFMVRLTKAELEANLWCVNTLSTSWLGAPDGTAIEGLKRKLLEQAQVAPRKGAGIPGPVVLVEGKGWA